MLRIAGQVVGRFPKGLALPPAALGPRDLPLASEGSSRFESKAPDGPRRSQEERFHAAKALAEKAGGIAQTIRTFGLSEDQRFEVAKVALGRHPYSLAAGLRAFDLPYAKRLELAQLAASGRDHGIEVFIANYANARDADDRSFSEAERFALAETRFQTGNTIASFLSRFQLAPNHEYAIAYLSASRAWSLGEPIRKGELKFSAAQTARLALRAIYTTGTLDLSLRIEGDRRMRLLATVQCKIATLKQLERVNLEEDATPPVYAGIVARHLAGHSLPTAWIPATHRSFRSLRGAPVAQLEVELAAFAERYPERLDPGAVRLGFSEVRHREAGLAIIQLASRVAATSGEMPKTARCTLAQACALPLPRDAKLSTEAISDAYAILGEVQSRLPRPMFEHLTFDSALFADRRLRVVRSLLGALRDAFMLSKGRPEDWDALHATHLAPLGGSSITDATVCSLTEKLNAEVTDRVRALFASDGIALDQLRALKDRWGSLDTFFTLVARYRGAEGWADCIPVLGRILSAEADDCFADYKFGGFPGDEDDRTSAQAQLAMLKTARQHMAWRKPRCSVRLDDDTTTVGASRATLLARIRAEADTTLLRHVDAAPALPQAARDALDALELTGDPSTPFSALRGHHGNEGARDALVAAFRTTLDASAEEDTRLVRLRRCLTYLQLLTRYAPEVFTNGDQLEQVKRDITSLSVAMKPASVERRATIVATALMHDAKSLLEVGDLVRTASCQNFRTGSHIQTLPGYVIDANVQALASFAIEEHDFATPAAAKAVFSALRAGSVTAELDSNARRFVFTLADGKTIVSNPLGYAYRRQMLKLGTTSDGRPGLYLERAYAQTHAAEVAMEDAHIAMLASVAADLDAVTGESITCIASRNPRGVYSDAAAGEKLGDYVIQGDPTQKRLDENAMRSVVTSEAKAHL